VIAFRYLAPASVREAALMLAEHGADARLLAGGQSLVPALNYRLARPGVVVDINRLPLGGITVRGDELRIGALVRHHELEESVEVTHRCPMLAEAASLVGNVRVRTLGTLGGSLAHADPAAELPLVACGLDARIDVEGPRGRRTVPAAEFFQGPFSTALAQDEIVVEIVFPVTTGAGTAVMELSRRPGDFALVAAAALVRLEGDGRVSETRLALGGIAGTPVRARAAEDALTGHEPAPDRIREAARAARRGAASGGLAGGLDGDAFASAEYRAHLVEVLARRALTRATGRAMEAR
jgi:aerobic carbon-monoxide dehydrogenase medium subunit